MMPRRTTLKFGPGEQNELQKAPIKKFLPRFGRGSQMLYVGDADDKKLSGAYAHPDSNADSTWGTLDSMEKRTRLFARAASFALISVLVFDGVALAEPSETGAQSPSTASRMEHAAAIGVDLMIMRPMSIAALIVGAIFLPPVALISAPSGPDRLRDAVDLFVLEPYAEAFERPLGDF